MRLPEGTFGRLSRPEGEAVINPNQWWKDLDLLYRNRLNSLLAVASRHVYNKDLALEVVHDAFAKAQEYFNNPKNKDRKVREQILVWLVLKAAKKKNKKESRELPAGDTRYFGGNNVNED
jgi:hypothetical protein